MCMLCVIPPNVIPSRSKLENSALNNPHGFGFAIMIPSENRILVEHTMNADESINRFIELRGKYPESYAMWHARYATHGSTSLDNCHPFAVGGDTRTYLGHNGILPVIEPKGDKRSDTRIFAEDLLPHIGGVKSLDNPQVYNLVEEFTHGSKVCILTLDPQAKQSIYLIHESKGNIDDSGVWWSNDTCELSYYTPYSYGSYLSKDEEWTCTSCMGVIWAWDDEDIVRCPYCHTCLWCELDPMTCMCKNEPEHSKSADPVPTRSKSRYLVGRGWDYGY